MGQLLRKIVRSIDCRDCGKDFEASTGLKEGLGIAASLIGIVAGVDGVYQHHHHDSNS